MICMVSHDFASAGCGEYEDFLIAVDGFKFLERLYIPFFLVCKYGLVCINIEEVCIFLSGVDFRYD